MNLYSYLLYMFLALFIQREHYLKVFAKLAPYVCESNTDVGSAL